MPKRVIDGEGIWRSEKLSRVLEKFRSEYANLLPLALANGTFEADPRRVWSQVYAFNRSDISVTDVEALLSELERAGMLFRWTDRTDGKVWGFWIGIDKPGRLPSASRLKGRHETLGPEPPNDTLEEYLAGHRPANGQPMVSLGSGSGFGSGTGALAEKRSRIRAPRANRDWQDGDPLFSKFWADYPRKIHGPDARGRWNGLSELERLAAVEGLAAFKISGEWHEEDGKYIPSPHKFIDDRRWEYPPAASENGGSNARGGNRRANHGVNSKRGTDYTVGRTVLPEL